MKKIYRSPRAVWTEFPAEDILEGSAAYGDAEIDVGALDDEAE